MKKNKFGEIVYNESDLIDLVMSNGSIPDGLVVEKNIALDNSQVIAIPQLYLPSAESNTVEQFDQSNQKNWYMPDEYKNFDIAEYLLSLCKQDTTKLQRVGKELLIYQDKGLFDLLKYLKYLVDTMKKNNIIWGVGRGSSVASYVLYLLEVHRVDSIYYDLDPEEFLR